jgi:hypothetical protein
MNSCLQEVGWVIEGKEDRNSYSRKKRDKERRGEGR